MNLTVFPVYILFSYLHLTRGRGAKAVVGRAREQPRWDESGRRPNRDKCAIDDPDDDMDSGLDFYVGIDEYVPPDEDMGPEYWQRQLGDAADHGGV